MTATPALRPNRFALQLMRATLLARGLVGLWFAMRILPDSASSWFATLALLADYLRVDGVFALVVGALFLRDAIVRVARREEILAIVFFVDGAGRIASGVAAHVWPGLTEFPVTGVVYLGIMAACTAAIGLTEALLVVREEVVRHGRLHGRPQFSAGPVGLAAIASIAFGVAAVSSIADLPLMRLLLGGHIVAAAGVMVAMAWSRRDQRAGDGAVRQRLT